MFFLIDLLIYLFICLLININIYSLTVFIDFISSHAVWGGMGWQNLLRHQALCRSWPKGFSTMTPCKAAKSCPTKFHRPQSPREATEETEARMAQNVSDATQNNSNMP